MENTVIIDCFPECVFKYLDSHAIIAVDVIRASTTVATALGLGRRIFPARTTDEAFVIASRLVSPLLVGEVGGSVPYGFDISNSPAEIALRDDNERPMVFISSSGTRLMLNADSGRPVYIGCLRNLSAVTRHVSKRSGRIAVIGAGTRGQFRREDQICCALIAKKLMAAGFKAENEMTKRIVKRWEGVDLEVIRRGRSAEYLRRTGQERDLEFILGHMDDLDIVPVMTGGEVRKG